MEKAYLNLIRYALDNGCTVSVNDGEGYSLKRSRKYNAIREEIEGVEEAVMLIRDSEGEKVGKALVILGLDPDETVADYTDNDWMEAWSNQYQ